MRDGKYRDPGLQLYEHHVVGEPVNREAAYRSVINSRNGRTSTWKALCELHARSHLGQKSAGDRLVSLPVPSDRFT